MAVKDKYDAKQIKAMASKQKTGDSEPGTKEYVRPTRTVVEPLVDIKPVALANVKTHRIVAFVVFLSTLIVYMMTQARTMSFWDSGEYATCASILGVPHPPGNPFYILFGRAFVAAFGWLFSHAILTAFISGLTSAFAVLFTYLITVKLVSMLKTADWEAMFAGVIAALFTAYSFTFWMNAIEAEVYSGLVFFVNLILWLTFVWVEKSEDFSHQNVLLLIAYLFFLGFCVHQTALQVAPAVMFIVLYPMLSKSTKQGGFAVKALGYTAILILGYVIFGAIGSKVGIDEFDKWAFFVIALALMYYELNDIVDKKVWLLGLLLVLVGLSSHIFLMIRAGDRPFINEGHPSTLQMFTDYVLRKQYGNTSFFTRRGNFFIDQLDYHFFRYFGMQWFNAETLQNWLKMPAVAITALGSAIIALLGAVGGYFQYKRNKHSFNYFLTILLMTTIAMVFIMNLSDKEVRDRDYFFVVGYNMWAIWLGIGALGIINLLKTKAFKAIAIVLLCALPIVNFVSQYNIHDRSQEYIALDYGINFLNSVEENAIIFTNGDNDTFPLWYAQAVHDPNAKEYVHKATDIYPTSESMAAIQKAMEFKNQQLKGIRKDVSIANLSLLNTPWYIRQIRDREGILFNMDEEQIDNLRIIQDPGSWTYSAGSQKPDMTFSIDYKSTPEWREAENFYRVSDLAVMQIIKDNFGKRPIYFAVTCESYIGFDDYIRNEGMVARVVSTKGSDQVNMPRLLQNINDVYEYRSINDKKVYKDENMRRLVMNYGSGFVRAATYYADTKQFDKAMPMIAKARQFIDSDLKLTDFNVRYYAGTGQWDKLDQFIQTTIFPHQDGWKLYISFIISYLVDNYPDKAVQYIKIGMLKYPENYYFAELATRFGIEYGRQNDVRALFDAVKPMMSYDLAEYYGYLNNTKPEDLEK